MNDKVCVVTGASSGIGKALAAAFAAQGAAVVGLARRFPAEPMADRLAPGSIVELAMDVADEAAVRSRFAELERVDVLVNNAGGGTFAPVVEDTLDQVRAMLDAHIVGTFLCSRAALPLMSDGGHIINVSSSAARQTFAGCAAYTAAKAGQAAFGRVLREEARASGVRVTNLFPGAVDTAIWDDKPGFDRSAMMNADELAAFVVDVLSRPGLGIEDVVVAPPGGSL